MHGVLQVVTTTEPDDISVCCDGDRDHSDSSAGDGDSEGGDGSGADKQPTRLFTNQASTPELDSTSVSIDIDPNAGALASAKGKLEKGVITRAEYESIVERHGSWDKGRRGTDDDDRVRRMKKASSSEAALESRLSSKQSRLLGVPSKARTMVGEETAEAGVGVGGGGGVFLDGPGGRAFSGSTGRARSRSSGGFVSLHSTQGRRSRDVLYGPGATAPDAEAEVSQVRTSSHARMKKSLSAYGESSACRSARQEKMVVQFEKQKTKQKKKKRGLLWRTKNKKALEMSFRSEVIKFNQRRRRLMTKKVLKFAKKDLPVKRPTSPPPPGVSTKKDDKNRSSTKKNDRNRSSTKTGGGGGGGRAEGAKDVVNPVSDTVFRAEQAQESSEAKSPGATLQMRGKSNSVILP